MKLADSVEDSPNLMALRDIRHSTLDSATATSFPSRQPGRGLIEVRQVAGRSVAIRARAESPLRLLTPRGSAGNAAWIFTSTFGGGLVGADQIDLTLNIGADATCLLATQASTKVFRSVSEEPARQILNATIADGATCVILPDPLTCFAGAAFEQRMHIELAASGSLVLLDWLTSGRRARGERWAFRRYLSRIDVKIASQLAFRDAIRLDEADGPIGQEHRMGRCDCVALLLLMGPRVQSACTEILAWAAAQPIERAAEMFFSASPLKAGAILRVAGSTTEGVDRWIRQRLAFLPDLIGADPWRRKC